MPSFIIRLERTVTHTTEFTFEAEDGDAAADEIGEIFANYERYSKFETNRKLEWELDDENYEVLEVTDE